MIYNAKLTDELVECFGEGVIQWNKSVIRTNLEDGVIRAGALVLSTEDTSIRHLSHTIYKKIKETDDEFTKLYMDEIENLKEKT